MSANDFTNAAKLKEVERELALRRNVYPAMVRGGRMKQEEMDRRIAILEAVAKDYQTAIAWEERNA